MCFSNPRIYRVNKRGKVPVLTNILVEEEQNIYINKIIPNSSVTKGKIDIK